MPNYSDLVLPNISQGQDDASHHNPKHGLTKITTLGRDLTGQVLGPAEKTRISFDSMYKIIFLIHVWVPRSHKIATKCVKFRLPEVPIPFSSVKFRAGSIFEV